MSINIPKLFCGIVLGILISQPVVAAEKGKGPGGHLLITEAFVIEGDPDTILINGEDFDFANGSLVVTLGEVGELTILSETATDIEVEIPELPAGDYLLTVFREGGQSQGDEYDLTIGAVGPQGPQGPQGPPGPPGPKGERGSAGQGCAITQCSVLGTAVITCGTSPSVEIPCT